MKKCKKDNCEKRSISFSEFCGQHTSNDEYKKTLNELKKGSYSDLWITEMELENITLNEIEFLNSQIIDCSFDKSSFHLFRLENSMLNDVLFSNSSFTQSFIGNTTSIISSSFQNCEIKRTSFVKTSINQTLINQTKIENADWHSSVFLGVDFSKSLLTKITVSLSSFDQSSFNYSKVVDCSIMNTKIARSILYDTIFDNLSVNQINTDFEEIDDPIVLCEFNNCSFPPNFISKNCKRWNAINENSTNFNFRILEHINESIHVPNLQLIPDIVNDLYVEDESNGLLSTMIQDTLKKHYNHVSNNQDFNGLGDIAKIIGRIPNSLIIQPKNYLPTPKLIDNQRTLSLTFLGDFESLEKLNLLITKLREFETIYNKYKEEKLRIISIQTGSVTIVVSSSVMLILFIIFGIYKTYDFVIDTNIKRNTNKKISQELELNDLEKTKKELEIKKLQKELGETETTPNDIKLLTGVDPQRELPQQAFDDAIEVGEDILDLTEGVKSYVELIEEDINRE